MLIEYVNEQLKNKANDFIIFFINLFFNGD